MTQFKSIIIMGTMKGKKKGIMEEYALLQKALYTALINY